MCSYQEKKRLVFYTKDQILLNAFIFEIEDN